MALLKVYLHGLFKSLSFKEVTAGLPDYEAADQAGRNVKAYDHIYIQKKSGLNFP